MQRRDSQIFTHATHYAARGQRRAQTLQAQLLRDLIRSLLGRTAARLARVWRAGSPTA